MLFILFSVTVPRARIYIIRIRAQGIFLRLCQFKVTKKQRFLAVLYTLNNVKPCKIAKYGP